MRSKHYPCFVVEKRTMKPRTSRKPNNSAGSNFHRKCQMAYTPARAVRPPTQYTAINSKHSNYLEVSDDSDQDAFQKKHRYNRDESPVRKKSGYEMKREKNIRRQETRKEDPDNVTECLIDKNYYSSPIVVDHVVDHIVDPISKQSESHKKINFNIPEEDEKILIEPEPIEHMDWIDYHPLDVIYNFMDELESNFPSLCSTGVIGTSVEGRNMKILKISNSNASNVSVWMDAGIHAREWIAPAVNTYIADHICRHFDTLPDSIRNKDWYFLPVVNPDGYAYSHTKDRMWRKNRAWHGNQCVGVDLNRNFSLGWGGRGSSDQPTNAFYRGPQPFSEPESSAMRDVFLNSGIKFKVYITLHSYGQIIIFPYACSSNLAPDYVRLLEGATAMSKAIYETNGNTYKVGISRDVMYGAAGTSNDFAHGAAGIPYCYLIELRSKKYKFKLPKEEIEETGTEILNCVKALMQFVDTYTYNKRTDDPDHIIAPEVAKTSSAIQPNTCIDESDPNINKGNSNVKKFDSYDKNSYSYIKRTDSFMKRSNSYIRWTKPPARGNESLEKTGDSMGEKKRFERSGECCLKKTDSKFSDTSDKGTEFYLETRKDSFQNEVTSSISSTDTNGSRSHGIRDNSDSFLNRNSSFLKGTAFYDEADSFLGTNDSLMNLYGKRIVFLDTNDAGIGTNMNKR